MPFNDPPWHPITDSVELKHLGKLAEELNECGSAVARCIIQGVDECDPVSGKRNREWLEDEMADVYANMQLVQEHYSLNLDWIMSRAFDKVTNLRKWHKGA